MSRNFCLAAALVLSSFGCATAGGGARSSSAPPNSVTVLGADGKPDLDKSYICEMVMDVGSHIPERVCRSLRQVDADRMAAMDAGSAPSAGAGIAGSRTSSGGR